MEGLDAVPCLVLFLSKLQPLFFFFFFFFFFSSFDVVNVVGSEAIMGIARGGAPTDDASVDPDGIMARHDIVRRRTGEDSFGTIMCLLVDCPEWVDDVAAASASMDFVEVEDPDW